MILNKRHEQIHITLYREQYRIDRQSNLTKEVLILWYLKSYYSCNLMMPTIQEIANCFGFKSRNSVYYWLEKLEQQGKINVNYAVRRGIVINNYKPAKLKKFKR